MSFKPRSLSTMKLRGTQSRPQRQSSLDGLIVPAAEVQLPGRPARCLVTELTELSPFISCSLSKGLGNLFRVPKQASR